MKVKKKTQRTRESIKSNQKYFGKKDIIIEIMNSSKAFSYTIGRSIDWYKYLGKLVVSIKSKCTANYYLAIPLLNTGSIESWVFMYQNLFWNFHSSTSVIVSTWKLPTWPSMTHSND